MSPKTGEEETAETYAVETMAMVKKDTPKVETKDPSLKGRQRFCKRRPTRCETCLLLVVIVLLIVGVVMTYLYVSSYLRTKDKTTESDKNQSGLCNTASCVFTASGKSFLCIVFMSIKIFSLHIIPLFQQCEFSWHIVAIR